jgi:hypothetical protein
LYYGLESFIFERQNYINLSRSYSRTSRQPSIFAQLVSGASRQPSFFAQMVAGASRQPSFFAQMVAGASRQLSFFSEKLANPFTQSRNKTNRTSHSRRLLNAKSQKSLPQIAIPLI